MSLPVSSIQASDSVGVTFIRKMCHNLYKNFSVVILQKTSQSRFLRLHWHNDILNKLFKKRCFTIHINFLCSSFLTITPLKLSLLEDKKSLCDLNQMVGVAFSPGRRIKYFHCEGHWNSNHLTYYWLCDSSLIVKTLWP